MRLIRYINEIKLTRQSKLKIGMGLFGDWRSTFKVGDLQYDVFISKSPDGDYSIAFGVIDKPLEVLGTGNAIKVFTAVTQSIKRFLKDMEKKGEPVEKLSFATAGDDKSRLKLYDRFAKKFDSVFGYKLISKEPIGYGEVEYIFKKK